MYIKKISLKSQLSLVTPGSHGLHSFGRLHILANPENVLLVSGVAAN